MGPQLPSNPIVFVSLLGTVSIWVRRWKLCDGTVCLTEFYSNLISLEPLVNQEGRRCLQRLKPR